MMPTLRTVDVRPPSVRHELGLVLRFTARILCCAAGLLILDRAAVPRTPGAGRLDLDQRAFADLPAPEQRMFRQIQEGIAEAERVRSTTGRWPQPAALAADGIPPFAPDPLDRAGHSWALVQEATEINYVGVAKSTQGPGFVVHIVEPDPGIPVDPRIQPDEVHHRLSDGTLLHVMIWMGPVSGTVVHPITFFNREQGWRQIIAGTQ